MSRDALVRNWSRYLESAGLTLYRDARRGPSPQIEPTPARSTAPEAVQTPPTEPAPAGPEPVPAPQQHSAPTQVAPPQGGPTPPPTEPTATEPETLAAIRADMGDCQRCPLGAGRNQLVFGEGNPEARLMFVGEGPGADEDRSGRPFVGKAGQLLTKMIEAMGLQREQVYIANVIKSRPPNNRDPLPEEIDACFPFLQRQIRTIQPEVIVTLGKPAARTLLGLDGAISRYRGHWQTYEGIPAMPTFHPAYLLRDERQKRAAWTDLQAVMQRLGLKKQG